MRQKKNVFGQALGRGVIAGLTLSVPGDLGSPREEAHKLFAAGQDILL